MRRIELGPILQDPKDDGGAGQGYHEADVDALLRRRSHRDRAQCHDRGCTEELERPSDSELPSQMCNFGQGEVEAAVVAAATAWNDWSTMDWAARAAVFLKAADLLAGPWRDTINAATMLGQSKNVFQAEVDAAAEMCDFWRFNAAYMQQIYGEQPESAPGIWDYVEYRPLEGFVFAVSPFNFTSIGGNLCSSPALMGNTVLWKPASTAVLSNYYMLQVLQEAGLPAGVINFVPGRGAQVGNPVFGSDSLAGLHFTGSTPTFQFM